jgi:hypothetical protein
MGGPLMPTNLQGTLQGQDVLGQEESRIANMFQSIMQQIQNAPQPDPIPTPPVASPLAGAGATFASTLASAILRQPGLALQTQARLERSLRAAQEVQRMNTQQQNTFRRQQFRDALGLRVQQLDAAIDAARDAGRTEDELKLQQLRIQAAERAKKLDIQADKELLEQRGEQAEDLTRLKGGIAESQIRLRQGLIAGREEAARKAALEAAEAGVGAAAGVVEKPLSIAQVTQRETEIAKSLGLAEQKTFLGIFPAGVEMPEETRDALTSLYINAIENGAPMVRKTFANKLVRLLDDGEGTVTQREDKVMDALLNLGITDQQLILEAIKRMIK